MVNGQSQSISTRDVVIGFFLDGDDGRVPIIMGMFGNSKFRLKIVIYKSV